MPPRSVDSPRNERRCRGFRDELGAGTSHQRQGRDGVEKGVLTAFSGTDSRAGPPVDVCLRLLDCETLPDGRMHSRLLDGLTSSNFYTYQVSGAVGNPSLSRFSMLSISLLLSTSLLWSTSLLLSTSLRRVYYMLGRFDLCRSSDPQWPPEC
jgi:hypothetical protein